MLFIDNLKVLEDTSHIPFGSEMKSDFGKDARAATISGWFKLYGIYLGYFLISKVKVIPVPTVIFQKMNLGLMELHQSIVLGVNMIYVVNIVGNKSRKFNSRSFGL